MTRVWPGGKPISVRAAPTLEPRELRWDGRRHPVAELLSRWRLEVHWWDEPVAREYVALCTADGLLLVVFCDLLDGQWYLERMYD